MKFALAFCIVLTTLFDPSLSLVDHQVPVFQHVEEWHSWKTTHGRRYNSHLEELEKHLTWLSNKAFIEQHNINADNGLFSYKMKLNHLADLTEKEYRDQYLTYQRPNRQLEGKEAIVKQYIPPKVSYWPESVDWRRKGAVANVKNQGNCGASYAFATIGALEGAISLSLDKSVEELSEQNIIDCSVPEGNNGCQGGNMYNSFMYVIFNDGINSEKSYKYQGMQTPCNFSYKSVAATMSGIILINSGNEEHLQAAVAYAGPVAAAIDARPTGFRFYSHGVFDSSRCTSYGINHALLIVGYGASYINGNRKEYWIAKNSWGTEWGEDGYVLMSKDSYNQCGIATDCSYPSL